MSLSETSSTVTPKGRTLISQYKPGQQWFLQARFGMFIHWGIYSILAKGEWALFKLKLDPDEYRRLPERLVTAKGFTPALWADEAVKMGATYVVLTSRHHDGFCLFDTKHGNFKSTLSAAKRDFIAEYVEAVRARGLKVGLYYSSMSWQHPALQVGPFEDPEGWEAMVRETHGQLEELMTNYGKIDLLWYDGTVVPKNSDPDMLAKHWRSHELNAMIRRLQPDILINDRSGPPEDFDTPEQEVVASDPTRMWESCMTLNHSWGYNEKDFNYKTPSEIIAQLVQCAQFGGNFLLNIGPFADGTLPPETQQLLDVVGGWVHRNHAAIFATERCPVTEASYIAGSATAGGRKIYFHFFGDVPSRFRLAGLGSQIVGACLLEDRVPCAIEKTGNDNVDIVVSGGKKGDLPLVVEVELSVPVAGIKPPQVLRVETRQTFASDVPILAVDTGRHKPEAAPILNAAETAGLTTPTGAPKWIDGQELCPGWKHSKVALAPDGAFSFPLEILFSGTFDLDLGLITQVGGEVEVTVGSAKNSRRFPASVSGYPWTASLPGLHLEAGKTTVTVRQLSGSGLGFYAHRLESIWRPVPSEQWLTSGPYPITFTTRGEVSEVGKALRVPHPPEASAFAAKAAVGDGLWTGNPERLGQFSETGVNFPYRCGSETAGICYALTYITSPVDQLCRILIGSDWWANGYINGVPLAGHRPRKDVERDGAEFNAWKPSPADLPLKAGLNTLLIKSHPGSAAHWMTCKISDPGNLTLSSTRP